jgi:hypothetical protein
LNTECFQLEQNILGDSPEDTDALKEMAASARLYLSSFNWCPAMEELFLAFGVGGVVALFLVHFRQKAGATDEFLWVVVGDLPSAYFVVDQARTPTEALNVYCGLMERWVDAVLNGKHLSDVFPVKASPSVEHAALLKKRIEFLRSKISPMA